MNKLNASSLCAFSSLPLLYLPPVRILHNTPRMIPFLSYGQKEMNGILQCAYKAEKIVEPWQPQCADDLTKNLPKERLFAFFALLANLPIEARCSSLNPAWQDRKLRTLLSNQGLQAMSRIYFHWQHAKPIESEALYEEDYTNNDRKKKKEIKTFPIFRISSEYNNNNTDLINLPAQVSTWLALCESPQEKQRLLDLSKEKEKVFFSFLPKRVAGEKLSLFDSRVSSPAELQDYAQTLAIFYQRKCTQDWLDFVQNPRPLSTINKIITRVKEINIAEADYSDAFALSGQFLLWLEKRQLFFLAQDSALNKMMKVIELAPVKLIQSLSLEHTHNIIKAEKERELECQMPQYAQFSSLSSYLTALNAWKDSLCPQVK